MHYRPLRDHEIRLLRLEALQAKNPQSREHQHKRSAARLRSFLRPVLEPNDTKKKLMTELECSFVTVSLYGSPPFEALSWVWGDASDVVSIKLNHEPFMIKSALHTILCNLRMEETSRLLWVDALCINQSDVEERNHQVTRMKDIYSQAANVIVWLGDSWNGDREAFELIKLIRERDDLHFAPKSGRKCIKLDGENLTNRAMRNALISFFDRPWWHRLWTVQEYVMANQVNFYCGLRMVSDLDLQVFLERLSKHRQSCCRESDIFVRHNILTNLNINSAANRYSELLKMKRDRNTLHFLQVVAACRRRLASDPRDKLYGLLGLTSQEVMSRVDPNYTLSAEHIFEDAVHVFIEQGKDLEVFSHLYGSSSLNLPSFVPDWTARLDGHIPKSIYFDRLIIANNYNACYDTTPIVRRVQSGSISCRGIMFDTISATGKPVVENCKKEELIADCREVSKIDLSLSASYVGGKGGQTVAAAFGRAMCGDILLFDDIIWSVRHEKDEEVLAKETKWEVSCRENKDKSGAVYFDKKIGSYHRAVLANITGRRFIRTEKGYFGTAPSDAEIGDFVAVLAGGKVPYVLRPKTRDLSYYQVAQPPIQAYHMLGDAFVQGLMYGEAFQDLDGNCTKLEDIILR